MATTTNGGTKISQTLATKIQTGSPLAQAEFKDLMSKMKAEIASALPMHLKNNADRYARQMVQLFSQNPKLQACRPVTLLSAMMTASALGLDLTPQLGQCYILPYENRKKDGREWVTVTEAQFQIGYRGAIALAQRSSQIQCIRAEVVHRDDEFRYSRGLHPMLEHVDSQAEDPGEMTHVYAVANFANGGYYFEVWPVAKVLAHAKKFSKSFYKKDYKTGELIENPTSPWKTDFESMAKKTLILAIWKYLPVSTEILMAATTDEAVRDDVSGVQDEKDVINIPIGREEEEESSESPLPLPDPQPDPTPNPGTLFPDEPQP